MRPSAPYLYRTGGHYSKDGIRCKMKLFIEYGHFAFPNCKGRSLDVSFGGWFLMVGVVPERPIWGNILFDGDRDIMANPRGHAKFGDPR